MATEGGIQRWGAHFPRRDVRTPHDMALPGRIALPQPNVPKVQSRARWALALQCHLQRTNALNSDTTPGCESRQKAGIRDNGAGAAANRASGALVLALQSLALRPERPDRPWAESTRWGTSQPPEGHGLKVATRDVACVRNSEPAVI